MRAAILLHSLVYRNPNPQKGPHGDPKKDPFGNSASPMD